MLWKSFIKGLLGILLSFSFSVSALAEIKVSENGRYLQKENGEPFFYMGDTAWALFHRLNREEIDIYLEDRAEKGFTVIQAVILAELNGLKTPNAQGDFVLEDLDPKRPVEAYFEHIDYTIKKANSLGLVVGVLPSWGHYWRDGDRKIFNKETAEFFGEYLGKRYKDSDVIWILGGDSNARSKDERDIIEALANGLSKGDRGQHLITFHPRGPGQSSRQFPNAGWLDFYMNQSSHAAKFHDPGLYAEYDRNLAIVKPTIDGEPKYEGIPVGFYNGIYSSNLRFTDDDTRRAAWLSIMAGAAGHTYGNNNVWQMWSTKHKPAISANVPWYDAIHHPGARQMGYLREFMELHSYERFIPDQSLILDGPLRGDGKIRAVRSEDDSNVIVYSSTGQPFTLDLGIISSPMHRQSWFDPRYGIYNEFRTEQSHGIQSFTPPSAGEGRDWVLVLKSD